VRGTGSGPGIPRVRRRAVPEAAIAQAALIEAKRALPQADEATLTAIENLRQADPTSSLADHYDAYFRFKEGDVAGAVQAVAAASEKDRFADHRLELLMSRYQCLRRMAARTGARSPCPPSPWASSTCRCCGISAD